MKKVPHRGRREFQQDLRNLLEMLENSCNALDAGQYFEAQRIAVELRKLFHDTTRGSTSLLTHLNAWHILLPSSPPYPVLPGFTGRLTTGWPNLVQCRIQGSETHFIFCGDEHTYDLGDAKAWWAEEVWVVPSEAMGITRRQIVLAAANQDGGAHVDANLDAVYRAVKLAGGLHCRRISTGAMIQLPFADPKLAGGECQPDSDMITACLRQMAYEVLHSQELRDLL